MQRRPLGSTGFQVAPLAFGGNVFGWSADKAMSFRLLDAFVDAGFDLVDTADVYSVWAPGHRGGESESIIGEWLAANPAKRERVVIATKCGMELAPDKTGLSRRWIRQACDDSLKRLRSDHIDLFQAHKDDPDTPLEESLAAFDELVKEGKVRAIGASNYSAQRLAQALEVSGRLGMARFATLQPEYNLLERAGFERELQPLCAKEGIAVINYFGLARGFLSGKYRSEADLAKSATRGGGVKKYLNERGMRVLAALDGVAEELGATTAQVALAWNMAQPTIAAPIASATSVVQLEELMGAARVVLDARHRSALSAASA
jgi:aryl-alcohol dehydrogenase-like predicted oxidoreductase